MIEHFDNSADAIRIDETVGVYDINATRHMGLAAVSGLVTIPLRRDSKAFLKVGSIVKMLDRQNVSVAVDSQSPALTLNVRGITDQRRECIVRMGCHLVAEANAEPETSQQA